MRIINLLTRANPSPKNLRTLPHPLEQKKGFHPWYMQYFLNWSKFGKNMIISGCMGIKSAYQPVRGVGTGQTRLVAIKPTTGGYTLTIKWFFQKTAEQRCWNSKHTRTPFHFQLFRASSLVGRARGLLDLSTALVPAIFAETTHNQASNRRNPPKIGFFPLVVGFLAVRANLPTMHPNRKQSKKKSGHR